MSQNTYTYWNRVFAISLLLMALFPPFVSASPKQKVVILASQESKAYRQLSTLFTAHLRNTSPAIEITSYLLTDNPQHNSDSLAHIKQMGPDLILALGTNAINNGLATLPDTPLVASMVMSHKSFALSKQATGVLLQIPPQIHFQWFQRFLPAAKNIGILYDPKENSAWIKKAEHEARINGYKLVAIRVETPKDLPKALKKLSRSAEVLVGIPDTTVYSRNTAKMVLLSTFRNHIPFIGLSQSWVKAGALYSLEWDYGDIGRQCGAIALKILTGISPATIPCQIPKNHVRFSINTRTANFMNLDLNSSLLKDALATYK